MAKYIEREALEVELNHRLNFLMGENGEYDHYTSGFDEAVTRVENFPDADVAPVRRGSWSEADDDGEYTCSHCGWVGRVTCLGKDKIGSSDIDYCPYCGAEMRGRNDE